MRDRINAYLEGGHQAIKYFTLQLPISSLVFFSNILCYSSQPTRRQPRRTDSVIVYPILFTFDSKL